MKKVFLAGIGTLAVASLMVSCGDDFGTEVAKGNGRISPDIRLNTETVTSRSTSESSRATGSATQIEVADLSLRLSKTDGSFSGEWTVADFPTDKDFSVGEYTLEAYYGDPAQQGFNLPAYYGSQTITVMDEETTRPSLTASLANAMVSIKYTDAFMGYMADYGATVNGIDYTKTEERPVYVTPGDVQITISVTKPNGLGAEFTLDNVQAEARHHYTVTVDVNNGGVGDARLTVTFDDMMETEEIEIDLSDKILSTPAPTLTPKGFTSGNTIDVVTGMPVDGSYAMNAIAMAGLRNVSLKTKSTSLLQQGWPEEIDLMTADANMQGVLTGLGLDVLGLWKTPGEMAVINFDNVPSHIKTIAGDDNITELTLSVKDKLMRETEALTLRFNVEDVMMDLKPSGDFFEPGAPLNVVLGFNGPGTYIKEKIQIEYYNTVAGVWNKLQINSVSEGRSRAMLDYTVNVNTPLLDDAIQLRARYENSVSNTIQVDLAPFEVEVNDRNVFSTYAFVRVVGVGDSPAPSIDNAKFQIKIGDSQYRDMNHTVENGYAKLTELAPATQYMVRVLIDGIGSKPTKMNTENGTPVPNGNLENWSSSQKTNGAMSVTIWNCEGWATFNDYTTNYLSSGTNYSAISSTAQTDGREGNGALIRTVGFDMSAASAGLNNFKKSSQGELFLGTYSGTGNEGAKYGISFNSRPQSLQFYYKYTAQNAADRGYAEITLLSETGAEIATNVAALDPADSYTLKTLPLSYAMGSAKAASIRVTFKSTNAGDTYLNSNNIPKHANILGILNDYYTGSKLYVDDIQLIY